MENVSIQEEVSKRFAPNLIMNTLVMVLNLLVGLLLVPYFIDSLGVAAYGIVPLATSITGYVTLVSDSLSGAISRYLTMEMRVGSPHASKTYNTSVFGIGGVVLALLPAVLLIAFLAPSVFDISYNTALSVQILFAGILGSVLVNTWCNNFATVMFAANRLDYMNAAKASQILLQVGLIVLTFTFAGPSLEAIGVSYLVSSLAYMAFTYLLSRRVCPDLRIKRYDFESDHFRSICSIGGWSLINSLGNLLFIQASLVITNIFLGASLGGQFGIVVTAVSAMICLFDTVSAVFTPIIYQYFSEKRFDEVLRICRFAVKGLGVIFAMPLAFLCVFSPQVLVLWVGEAYVDLSLLIWITMVPLVGIAAISPVYPLSMAYLKMKVPGIATFLSGLANVLLALTLVTFTDLGLVGIALSWSVTMFVKNCVFNPWYHARISGLKGHVFHVSLLYGFACFAMLLSAYYGLSLLVHIPASWPVILGLAAALFAVHLLVTVLFVFDAREKSMIAACVPATLSKRIPRWLMR
jgi:membrane protein EpsK